MDVKDYIAMELDGVKRGLDRTIKGLSEQEVGWRPSSGCNPIGLILFHIAKSEDSMVQGTLAGKSQIWDSQKWYEKLKLDKGEQGAHYTAEQVNAFPCPDQKAAMSYYDAVRAQTLSYLKGLSSQELEKKVMLPFGEFTVAGVFSIIVSHTAQHIGEMSYIRGLQRGMDK